MGFISSIRERYRSFVRYNQILRVFVRYGFEELVSYMIETDRLSLIRRLIPKTTKKHAQKYTKWEKMRLVCEELGPTFIKFGQILSNRPDLLPEDLILQFEKLQDNVPPLPGEVAREVVERELKASVDELFAWFEPEAFASASMAQVHRVTLKTGEKVALKIQRPGIKAVIIEDIKVMYQLAEIFEKRIPSLKSFDPKGLVRNFEESILKELDFIHESVNVQRFGNNVSEDQTDKTTHVPKIYRHFTTSKVLALEFIQGIKVSDVAQLTAKGYDCKKISRELATSYIKQVFQYGFFHADPHPGNILVTTQGNVCFLDFGMMGSILGRDIEMFGNLFISVKAKDIKGIIRALQQMSEVTVIRDMRALEFAINEFVQSYSVRSYHENEMSTILMELKDVIVDHGLKVPPHFFLLARSMVTIEGVIHHLDPDLDLLELARPYLIRSIKKELNPLKFGKKILNGIYEFGSYMEDFPLDLKNAIRKINNGKVKVDLTHKGIDPMVHTANRITKHIVTAVIVAGLIIGSALFVINDTEPKWNGVPTYSVIGIIVATILAYGMWKDFRKGDHDDWKGWEEED
ncbi:MAG: ABC1 kinase family protein [Flavobacteriia bacterium]|jgi:ubiquinone biosynthesis protein